jgi:hypothetical protein
MQIQGDQLSWTASADQPWVQLGAAAGSGPASVSVSVNSTGLPAGDNEAHVTVRDTKYQQVQMVNVHFTLTANELTVSPGSASFAVDAGTTNAGLATTINISDTLGSSNPQAGLRWALQSTGASWLKASPASGSSAPAAQATLSLDKNELAKLGSGSYAANVVLQYTDSAGVARTATVSVGLALALPRVSAVMPYAVAAGHAVPLVLTGSGLQKLNAGQVTIGGNPVSTLSVLSDTTMRVMLPALPAGTYPVSVSNITGQNFSTGAFTVIPAVVRPYQAFASSGMHTRLVFDDVRQTLYAVNVDQQRIERYHYDGSAWQALTPWLVASVTDASLTPDGQALIAIGETSIYRADLKDSSAVPQVIHSGGLDTVASGYLYRMAVASDSHVILTTDSHCCSGNFPVFNYDLNSGDFNSFPYPVGAYLGQTLATGDTARLFIGGAGVYDAATSSLMQNGAGPSNLYDAAVDARGDRTADNGNEVHDEAQNLLGYTTMASYATVPAVSQDGRRAYYYRQFSDSPTLGQTVYGVDLSVPAGSNQVFPQLFSVPIADDPGQAPYPGVVTTVMAVSADGRTLFLAAQNKLVIVALPDN